MSNHNMMFCPRCGRPDPTTCGCADPGRSPSAHTFAADPAWAPPPGPTSPTGGPPPPTDPAWAPPANQPPPIAPAWAPPTNQPPPYQPHSDQPPNQPPPNQPPPPPGWGQPGAAFPPPAPSWSPQPATPPRRRRRRGAVIAGVVLVGVIGSAVAGAAVGHHHPLASQVVDSPGPGMVATAVGAGGEEPVTKLPGATSGDGIRASGVVPTSPTIYLQPAQPTTFGVKGSKEPAYWKVWWDQTDQVKAVVSLQQHTSANTASRELGYLEQRNSDVSRFNGGTFDFTRSTNFTVPGVPGATGYLWDGTEGNGTDSLPVEFRFATFRRGSVVALVSMTAYAETTDETAFDAFAQAEYSKMG